MESDTIRTGLWGRGTEEIDFVRELAQYPTGVEGAGMDIFLHGICGCFALALHRTFGYPISWILEDDYEGENPWSYLVHLFCYKPTDNNGNAPAWIDVRGATDDDRKFCEEFEDFFDYPGVFVVPPTANEVRTELVAEMGEKDFALFYRIAKKFIEEHLTWYHVS